MAAKCSKCGRTLESADAVCPCTPPAYVLNAEPGHLKVTGGRLGTVVEGRLDSPDGRRVDSRPGSGGHASSTSDSTGAFTAELSDPLDRGHANQDRAVGVLVQALRDKGAKVDLLPDAQDHKGEDALLSIDGCRTVVQVVTLPADQALWEKLSTEGMAVLTGTIGDAVELVHDALLRKKGSANDTLLLLDAAHVGAIIRHSLVENYRAKYGDIAKDFSFIDVWIVGPTATSAIRLGGP